MPSANGKLRRRGGRETVRVFLRIALPFSDTPVLDLCDDEVVDDIAQRSRFQRSGLVSLTWQASWEIWLGAAGGSDLAQLVVLTWQVQWVVCFFLQVM